MCISLPLVLPHLYNKFSVIKIKKHFVKYTFTLFTSFQEVVLEAFSGTQNTALCQRELWRLGCLHTLNLLINTRIDISLWSRIKWDQLPSYRGMDRKNSSLILTTAANCLKCVVGLKEKLPFCVYSLLNANFISQFTMYAYILLSRKLIHKLFYV